MFSALERLQRLRAGEPVPVKVADTEGMDDPAFGVELTIADLPPDWRVEWEERAAIREYEAGQSREYAEAKAFYEILARMRAAEVDGISA